MRIPDTEQKSLTAGALKLEIYQSRQAAAEAAARVAAESLRSVVRRHSPVGVIFATGASQLETLRALTTMSNIPWDQVIGFHMDEYLGIGPEHPASFRRYLREHLTGRVRLREFHEIDGTTSDPERTCSEYGDRLRSQRPQLCLLGIGENGHLAFNDPAEANFWDSLDAKVVSLDQACRQQQVAEGWFQNLQEVPPQALTLTIPVLMRVPKLIISVPGGRKAKIVSRTLTEAISTDCPATILRTHPNATVYLDEESAAQLDGSAFL
ncbi:MAG: glucosamine-6-phosphate deaminase [Terriglobia bacterium]